LGSIIQNDSLKETISGICRGDIYLSNKEIVDFGKVELGKSKEAIDIYTITNRSSYELALDKVVAGSPENSSFQILSDNSGEMLAIGEKLYIDLKFEPERIGRISGTIEVHYEGVGSPAIIQLYGEGVENLSSINKTDEKCILKVSPNPNNGFCTVEIDQKISDPYSVKIMNILGEELIIIDNSDSSVDRKFNIDLSSFASGQYIVVLQTKSFYQVEKIVLMK
jgi:hypothetical protein